VTPVVEVSLGRQARGRCVSGGAGDKVSLGRRQRRRTQEDTIVMRKDEVSRGGCDERAREEEARDGCRRRRQGMGEIMDWAWASVMAAPSRGSEWAGGGAAGLQAGVYE